MNIGNDHMYELEMKYTSESCDPLSERIKVMRLKRDLRVSLQVNSQLAPGFQFA